MSKADVVAAMLLFGATLYAIFGGADFGAGIWELFSRRTGDPEAVRRRIERSIAPVWEANHVWLIFILVFFWTGFPEAFSAVMSTLYIPLALAAVGIVLRGSGFAFGKVIEGPWRTRANLVFALSSVVTPFFLGTVIGAIASGGVPAEGNGDPIASWTGVLPLLMGGMFVSGGAYMAAVFLIHDAASTGERENARQFGRWALGAALVAGAFAAAGIPALRADARVVYDGLTGDALPLAIASVACGAAGLALILRAIRRSDVVPRGARPLAVAAFVSLIWGGGVAFHPYLLPPAEPFNTLAGTPAGLTITESAAPSATLTTLLIVFGLAALIVIPALGLLYTLSQKRLLE